MSDDRLFDRFASGAGGPILLGALRAAERERTSFALLLVELDRLRAYTEMFGPSVGALLIDTARARIDAVADRAAVVHLDGPTLCVLVTRFASPAALEPLAQAILTAIAQPVVSVNLPELRPVANVGFAVFPDDARSSRTLFDCAQAALTAAKARGRNTAVRHSPLN